MFKIFDFRCTESGHVFERFVKSGTTTSRCGCGADATKMVSAPSFHLNGADASWPGAHMKWAREHEKAGNKQ